jgi:hypothetical protein
MSVRVIVIIENEHSTDVVFPRTESARLSEHSAFTLKVSHALMSVRVIIIIENEHSTDVVP